MAELPTCQNTLQALAPLMRLTEAPGPVIRVLPAWNTQTESSPLCPSRTSGTVPEIPMPEECL